MAPPTLGIFALYASLILLTSHRPIILHFHKLNKILWQNHLVLLVFVSLCIYNIFANNYLFFNKIALLNNNTFVHFDG